MKKIILASLVLTMFGGCVVRPRPVARPRTVVVVGKACPIAHHWNGNRCVHN